MFHPQQSNDYLRLSRTKKKVLSSKKSLPNHEEIDRATKLFLEQGGQIKKTSTLADMKKDSVFRANLEPESRLGMGSMVDDSWNCWDKQDYS